jgi:hypothetical protein
MYWPGTKMSLSLSCPPFLLHLRQNFIWNINLVKLFSVSIESFNTELHGLPFQEVFPLVRPCLFSF